MSYSLNEIEVTAKKAARGAGYSWGMAEEAGKAARWLCIQGQEGCATLAGFLGQIDGQDLSDHTPLTLSVEWKAKSTLCPLTSGAALSDCAADLQSGEITLKEVIYPALLMPFAARAAVRLGRVVALECEGARAVTNGAELSLDGVFPTRTTQVVVSLQAEMPAALPRHTRGTPTPEDLATLSKFAHRTYAPATEESRLLGAGAGLSDND
ncbi:hypothetical protein ROA7450_02030 [Roseovarius albus]|uniref:DUF3726 domain-containing protein n=1 Tax=Roseovarius albus TaxID=1247867 RepID=A0A1X6Z5R8_9RHOB|nr:DUF3726 domain-containing protein [Roseovarius albus]SLN41882.1 hypothetical protein ROA7450_02030 [Roseovarius albus]